MRTALVVLALASGCKAKPRAAPVEPPADAEVVEDAGDADVVALEDAIAAGAIEVAFVQETGPVVSGNVIYVDETATSSKLVITNRDEDARIAPPPYLFAHLPGYVYPYGDEGCLPAEQWLIATPTDEVALAAGARVELPITALWYLGNRHRPPPAATSGSTTTLAVSPAPAILPIVKLADAVRDTPDRAALAFTLAGGCTAEPWLTDATLAHTAAATIAAVERALDDAGVRTTTPVFDQARAKREAQVALLRDQLGAFARARTIEGLGILYASSDPTFLAFFAGDVEVAELAARYLEPDATGRRPQLVVFLLEQLHVATPAVLDALDRAATDDADPDTRAKAGAAAAVLRAAVP